LYSLQPAASTAHCISLYCPLGALWAALYYIIIICTHFQRSNKLASKWAAGGPREAAAKRLPEGAANCPRRPATRPFTSRLISSDWPPACCSVSAACHPAATNSPAPNKATSSPKRRPTCRRLASNCSRPLAQSPFTLDTQLGPLACRRPLLTTANCY